MNGSIVRLLWALTLVTLPITSFRWLPLGATVSPLSLVFLLPTLMLAFVSARRRVVLANSPIWILVLFTIWAVAITVWQIAGYGSHVPVLKPGAPDALRSAFNSCITLFIGAAFYATAIMMTTNREELHSALRWIVVGLSINAVVAVVQGITLLGFPSVYATLDHFFSSYIAIDTYPRPGARGLTLEPSWLASQLTVLGLPIVLARSFNPLGARSWRIRTGLGSLLVKPNWLLFALFMAAIGMSFSRAGLAVSIVSLLIAGIFRLTKIKSAKDFLVAAIVLPTVVAVTTMASLSSPYVRATFDLPASSQSAVYHYAKEIGGGGRLAFWMTSWNTFSEQPITGVGLGQSPFYFYRNVPLWAYNEYEVVRYMSGELINQGLPNAKNMVFRALAETGLVGAAMFAAFLATHFVYALTSRGVEVTVFCVVLIVALVVDFWSLDTFALPTFWWALALLWAISRLKREERSNPVTYKKSSRIQER